MLCVQHQLWMLIAKQAFCQYKCVEKKNWKFHRTLAAEVQRLFIHDKNHAGKRRAFESVWFFSPPSIEFLEWKLTLIFWTRWFASKNFVIKYVVLSVVCQNGASGPNFPQRKENNWRIFRLSIIQRICSLISSNRYNVIPLQQSIWPVSIQHSALMAIAVRQLRQVAVNWNKLNYTCLQIRCSCSFSSFLLRRFSFYSFRSSVRCLPLCSFIACAWLHFRYVWLFASSHNKPPTHTPH